MNPSAYLALYPQLTDYQLRGDVNANAAFDNFDMPVLDHDSSPAGDGPRKVPSATVRSEHSCRAGRDVTTDGRQPGKPRRLTGGLVFFGLAAAPNQSLALRTNRQSCRFPRTDAARNLRDVSDAGAL